MVPGLGNGVGVDEIDILAKLSRRSLIKKPQSR
jgi:hypothetical protein